MYRSYNLIITILPKLMKDENDFSKAYLDYLKYFANIFFYLRTVVYKILSYVYTVCLNFNKKFSDGVSISITNKYSFNLKIKSEKRKQISEPESTCSDSDELWCTVQVFITTTITTIITNIYLTFTVYLVVAVLVAKLCLTLCNP